MNAFLVELENKPGALATLAEAIAAKGVNITGVAGTSCDSGGRVAIVTADDTTTRMVLQNGGHSFKEIEVTETHLRDEPGTLAKATRRLAQAGVNVEAIFPTGMSGREIAVAFVTNNPSKAREALATAASVG
ncbi:MAG TPA: hypothetical protein VFO78_01025 [Candidatus Limnocylindrales bacterium]|nr:hypothetical protein [Candidatus Limnocylindrales bacterium]